MLNAKVRLDEVEQAIEEVLSISAAAAQSAAGKESEIMEKLMTGNGADFSVEVSQVRSLIQRFMHEEPDLATGIAMLAMVASAQGKSLPPTIVATIIFRAAEIAWVREHKGDPISF